MIMLPSCRVNRPVACMKRKNGRSVCVLLSRVATDLAGRPISQVNASRALSCAGQVSMKCSTVSGCMSHAGHIGDGTAPILNRCLRSGACPDLSWNRMAACLLGSPATSCVKCFEGREGSIQVTRACLEDCRQISSALVSSWAF